MIGLWTPNVQNHGKNAVSAHAATVAIYGPLEISYIIKRAGESPRTGESYRSKD